VGQNQKIMKKAVFAASSLVALILFSPLAFAHAILVASTPSVHATVNGPALAIDLKFNSRVDGVRSRLTLVLPTGQTQLLARVKQPAPEELAARAELTPGAYKLRWQAVAADGHITRGEIPFSVK
jgi:hypothetical protein